MSAFQFYLNQCVITDTRSVHEDTLVGGLVAVVERPGTSAVNHTPQGPSPVPVFEMYGPVCAQLGDHNNGTFTFWQKGLGSLDQVMVNPGDHVTFLYQLINNGHGGHPNLAELNQLLADNAKKAAALADLQRNDPAAAQVLVSQADLAQLKQQMAQHPSLTDAAGIGIASMLTGGLAGVFAGIFKSCDGMVAAGQYQADGATLAQRVASSPGAVLTQTDTSHGKTMGWGAPCNGAGSNYLVSWVTQAR